MAGLSRKFSKSRRGFIRRQDGSPTVEAVLWLPLFLVIFGFMVDGSLIFFGQAKMLRVVQDANRNMSIGRLADPAETEAYVEATLGQIGITVDATSDYANAGVITTIASTTVDQLEILGTFGFLTGDGLPIVVTADHMIENWEG